LGLPARDHQGTPAPARFRRERRHGVLFATATVSHGRATAIDHGVSQVMSVAEREWFLSGPRLGVLSVAETGDRGPVTVPIWYVYEPGGELHFIIGQKSRKAELINKSGRVSLCAHNDDPPYRYVTVEGPVTAVEEPVTAEDRASMAYRYLGPELAERYLAGTTGDGLVLIRVRPEHWSSADFGKHPA
jgi:nitroimidazol reductase NimA-like FMN-containing flavoprotein (pyridoxamine 5'-phosphate oxidase superfamily)